MTNTINDPELQFRVDQITEEIQNLDLEMTREEKLSFYETLLTMCEALKRDALKMPVDKRNG